MRAQSRLQLFREILPREKVRIEERCTVSGLSTGQIFTSLMDVAGGLGNLRRANISGLILLLLNWTSFWSWELGWIFSSSVYKECHGYYWRSPECFYGAPTILKVQVTNKIPRQEILSQAQIPVELLTSLQAEILTPPNSFQYYFYSAKLKLKYSMHHPLWPRQQQKNLQSHILQ